MNLSKGALKGNKLALKCNKAIAFCIWLRTVWHECRSKVKIHAGLEAGQATATRAFVIRLCEKVIRLGEIMGGFV